MIQPDVSRASRFPRTLALVFVALLLLTTLASAAVDYPSTYLVSAGPPPNPPTVPPLTFANLTSEYASTSFDGLRTVFTSDATNLDPRLNPVGGDSAEGTYDVFLRVLDPDDPSQGHTYLVSSTRSSLVNYNGTDPSLVAAGADGRISAWAAISRDGKWVVFQSNAAPGVLTGSALEDSPYIDIFLFNVDDLIAAVDPVDPNHNPGRTLVSRVVNGPVANGHSGNTTYKDRVFSDPYPPAAVYVRSNDQPCVVYQSNATNLDPGFSDGNARSDLFVWCRSPEDSLYPSTNRLLTRTAAGGAANGDSWHPSVSYDGRYVAFVSDATNLVAGASGTQVYLMDRDPDGDGDLNNTPPAYSLVSRTTSGGPGNGRSWYPSISASGNFVAFSTQAANLELQLKDLDEVTPLAADTNNVTDIYLYNHRTGRTQLVSYRPAVNQFGANSRLLAGDSVTPSISADGRFVAFKSYAIGVTSQDDNLTIPDVFFFDRYAVTIDQSVLMVSLADDSSSTITDQTAFPAISGNRRFVFFTNDDRCFPLGHDTPSINCDAVLTNFPRNIMVRDLGPQPGEGALGVAPGAASFTPVLPGQSKTLTFTLKNWGSQALTVVSLSVVPLAGADPADFTISPNACKGAVAVLDSTLTGLAGDAQCTFTVTYAPTGDFPGMRRAKVTVAWSYSDGSQTWEREDDIALEGSAIQVYLPAVRR